MDILTEEDSPNKSIRFRTGKKLKTVAEILPKANPDLYASANCKTLDPTIFENKGGISRIQAFQICVGCNIRLEHLVDELRYGNPVFIVGGFSAVSSKRMRSVVYKNQMSTLPQLEGDLISIVHFEFMKKSSCIQTI